MDSKQISSGLSRRFQKHRIIFWHDQEGEFAEMLDDLALDGVKIIRLAQTPALAVKVLVELEQPKQKFILYETGKRPALDKDWLLDIRLYADPFAADRSTMILRELGLHRQSLRNHVAARAKFFANKSRLACFGKMVDAEDNETALDCKIMAVLLRLDVSDFFTLLRSLYHKMVEETGEALDKNPQILKEFEKYGVADTFWTLAETFLGYAEAEPSLKNLLIQTLVTDFSQKIECSLPKALVHLQLPRDKAPNSVICMGQWRDSNLHHSSYDCLSSAVCAQIRLADHLDGLDIASLQDTKTFLEVEKYIASQLRDRVIETANTLNIEMVRDIVSRRHDSYWANDQLPSSGDAPRNALARVYDALMAGARLFDLRNHYADGFSYPTPEAFYQAYVEELYQFDQLYRLFGEAANSAKAEGWDILKALRDKVEDCYGNWFIDGISLKWGDHVQHTLLPDWQIKGVRSQQNFFKDHLQKELDQNDTRRVFVIISDAFRFEAAKELADKINGQYRFSAQLETMLGVLPSYTGLGMAALLPHQQLSYSDKGIVHVDGQSSSGIANRQRILDKVEGIAIKADDFMAMKKMDGRAFLKPYRVVYIYHNQIDQTADTGNEEKTFDAVRTTIDEVANLVTRIVNHFNGNFIAVTADHGFLFQETPPSATDKNALSDKPAGTVIAKKRYLLGKDLGDHDTVYYGETQKSAGVDGGMEFWLPRGTNRFHFVGGARFIHGGAMLQEVVVPLLKVVQIKGKKAEKTKTRHVGISVLGDHFKITTNRYKFKFIQTEAVSERVKPLSVQVAIYDGQNPVTNLESITFDDPSSDMNKWQKGIWLVLAKQSFNKRNQYQLILRNADTGVEEVRIDVIIDLAFENDF